MQTRNLFPLMAFLLWLPYTAVHAEKMTPLPVIFETDMGNDVDDALALDMLYKYADQGLIRLLAINSNKDNPYSSAYIDILNTWYGYPGIPIGKVAGGANSDNDSHNYAQTVCELKAEGQPAFAHSAGYAAGFPESVSLYRRILAKQKDHSVVIISVGFSTNIARLYDSGPDPVSGLSGKELIAQKVKLLCVMGGNFEGKRVREYNIVKDIPSAKKVFAQWPTPIVTSPFELGLQVEYPASVIQHDFSWTSRHPVVEAYKSYLPMPYNRPTWDLTAVLYAVESLGGVNDAAVSGVAGIKGTAGGGYFHLSPPGFISVTDDGYTDFRADPSGRQRYLEVTAAQAEKIKQRFIQLTTAKPKHWATGR